MANINQNGIDFNNYKTAGVPTNEWPFRLTGQQGPDDDGGIVNAVDIDWNGAELDLSDSSIAADVPGVVNGKKVINTTGELFADIDESFPFIRFGAA